MAFAALRALPEPKTGDMRDALAGWIEAKPYEAADYAKNALTNSSEIIRRPEINPLLGNAGSISERSRLSEIGPLRS
jgi:hypothetical protein